ncbi:efflux RND transporter periplasmic adaptor subunit [Aquabacterium sp.]|uniref:efflux RND transporter periplasmic adaptor subunit n=1 Tax=Aquabacterium sp. TaxID=1872578 RepID=UPI0035AF7760
MTQSASNDSTKPAVAPDDARAAQLATLLQAGGSSSLFGRHGRWVWGGIVLLLVAAIVLWLRHGSADGAPRYRTEEARQGDLVVTVSATGNLQPTTSVDVGSELSGTIESVLVDENDHVKKGQMLARLDVSKLQDTVVKSRAALESAQAQVLVQQATVAQAQANLSRLQQVAQLSGGKVPSKAELETAEADLKRAHANDAAARAAVAQASASLRSDETNLTKASIRSPIDGIVLTRKIQPGQTVAASLQAPVLFTLAENLAQMELQVKIDEADVGQVRDDQRVEFTVDAYPSRKYPARIKRVDFGSSTTDGVVSYLGVLSVNNDDLSLRPGMTATATITTVHRQKVLLVPNAALRFTPPAAPVAASQSSGSLVSSLMPRMPRAPATAKVSKDAPKQVWVLVKQADGTSVPTAVPVAVGASDGRHTEITSGKLQAGDAVITESISAAR